MEKVLKTAKITLSLIVILMLIFSVGITMAENSEEIKIVIGETPNVDIVLSKGDTALDLTNFETDLKAKLEEEGVDLSKVNLKTVEAGSMSSNSQDAATIFSTWTRIGYTGQWYYDSSSKSIINKENTDANTGFVFPGGKYGKITLSYNNYTNSSDDDVMGSLIRFNINADGTVTGYMFAIDGGGMFRGLYKFVNASFTARNSTTYAPTQAKLVYSISNKWSKKWIN